MPVDRQAHLLGCHPMRRSDAPLETAVRRWLLGEGISVRTTRRLDGGHSNDNLHLVTDAGEEYVLRRYPGRNACAVEAALAERLHGVVPIAQVVAADPDGASAGRPVMVSRFVRGDLAAAVL